MVTIRLHNLTNVYKSLFARGKRYSKILLRTLKSKCFLTASICTMRVIFNHKTKKITQLLFMLPKKLLFERVGIKIGRWNWLAGAAKPRKASLSPTKGKLMDPASNGEKMKAGKGAKGRLQKQQSLPHGEFIETPMAFSIFSLEFNIIFISASIFCDNVFLG